jgi:hypothetical protein
MITMFCVCASIIIRFKQSISFIIIHSRIIFRFDVALLASKHINHLNQLIQVQNQLIQVQVGTKKIL